MAMRKIPNFKNLTPREKMELARCLARWRRKMQPMIDVVEESARITGDDLRIWIGPAPLRDEIERSLSHRHASKKKPSP